jgi:hypothetical protein
MHAPVVRHIAQPVVRYIAQRTPPDRESCRGQTVKLMAGMMLQVSGGRLIHPTAVAEAVPRIPAATW